MTSELITTFLSSLHQTFRDRISSALLIPVTTALIALVFLDGSTRDWDWYTKLWDKAGAVEKALLVGVVAFGVLFVVAALDSLTPQVNRLFEHGVWPLGMMGKNHYREKWDDLNKKRLGWEELYGEFKGWFWPQSDPPASSDDDELAPDPSWRTGMRLLTLTVADDHLPDKLKAGQVVNLHTLTGGILLHGGALVTEVSTTTEEETIDGNAIALREITVAVPPETIRELAAVPADKLLISRRASPKPTPFWNAGAGWTRRWIVAAQQPKRTDEKPESGDLIRLLPAGGQTEIDATFCERIGDRWIVAFKEEDLGTVPDLAVFRDSEQRASWSGGTKPVPLLSAFTPQWGALPAVNIAQFSVHCGVITVDQEDYRAEELILDKNALVNRYATGRIPEGSPLLQASISPADQDVKIVSWDEKWGNPPVPGKFCHFRTKTKGPTGVLFNCRMLDDGKVAIPTKAALTKDSRLLYSNGGALPASPSNVGGLAPWYWETAVEYRVRTIPPPKPDAFDVLVFPGGDADAMEAVSPAEGTGDRPQAPLAPKLAEGIAATAVEVAPPADATAPAPGIETQSVSPPAGSSESPRTASSATPAIIASVDTTSGIVTVLARRPVTNPDGPRRIDGSYLRDRQDLIDKLCNEMDPDKALELAKQLRDLVQVAHAHLQLDAEFQPARGLRMKLANTEGDGDGRRVRETLQFWVDQSREELNLQLPRNRNLVVGTELGNIVQTITSHGHEAYGMHTPLTLSRILAKVPAEARKGLDAAKEQITLLQWSFVASLIVAIAGAGMLFRDGAPWLLPIALYAVAGVALPIACLRGLRSAGLNYAAEAKFLMDSQRGLVLDALGIGRPKGESGKALIHKERVLWNTVGQWLEYGTEDYSVDAPTYTVPPAKGDAPAKEAAS